MKLIGLFNPFGYNILTTTDNQIINLNLIYEENGKYFIKYLDSGDLPFLLTIFERIKTEYKRELELDCFLNEKQSIFGFSHTYTKIKNEYFYEPLNKTHNTINNIITKIKELREYLVFTETGNEEDYTTATIFPNKKLFIGSRKFIYENNLENFKIENKNVNEIKSIITWLINNFYLEEAKEIINKIKYSKINLEKYNHPKNLIVFDGSTNFLDESLNRIEGIEFVKKRTKNLKIFEK